MSKTQVVDEIHKQARRNFNRCPVVLKGIDDLWQADLIEMLNIKKINKGFKYILVVIDAFSKLAWTLPVKSKSKNEISIAFERLLTKGRKPVHLQTDHGKEFYNDKFQHLMKLYKINHYSTYSVKKASIVERLIRTLKNKLYKYFNLVGNYKWIGKPLQCITAEYNNTLHRTTKHKPIDINTCNATQVMHNIYKTGQSRNTKTSKLQSGDHVRISKYKGVFEKGYTPNWSTEIFTITKVNNTNPPTFIVEDQQKQKILGLFYEQELQKTKYPNIYLIEKVLRKKGNKLYVKWLGLSENHNSWINKNSLL